MVIDTDMEHFDEDYFSDSSNNLHHTANDIAPFQDDYVANLFSKDNDPILCDLDIRLTQIGLETASDSSSGTSCGTSLFDSDEEDTVDLYGWRRKRVDEWSKMDTINWLISAGLKIGHSYSQMSPELALTGNELLRLSKEEFIVKDPNFGEELFNLLHKRNEAMNSPFGSEYFSDDEMSVSSDSVASDAYSDGGPKRGKKRVGRPPTTKKIKEPREKLWEFIRNSLHNPERCPRLIAWVDREEKTFRFVQSAEMARLWGERNPSKNKAKKMTFDNFSRAMRYYYKQHIFENVPRRRLVYKFGKNATGLDIDCPNFDSYYYENKMKSES